MRVKAVVIIFLGLLLAAASFAQTKKPLANGDVIQMVKAGFPQETVIKAIQANDTNFDVSVQGLINLKNAGVSQPIIDAMLSATEAKHKGSEAAPKPANEPPPDPNNPMSPHSPGIYWLIQGQSGKRLVRLQPTAYSQAKAGGFFGAGLTMGIKKASWKAVVPGAKATLRITEATPEFWFYFSDKSQGFQSGPLAVQASRPQEFALAQMERHGKERSLVVGQMGITGASMGVRDKDAVPVDVQQIAPGIYKVTPRKPLAPGEYCFVPPGGAVGYGMAGGTLFDFGIDKAK
jgi:hypothetical protein